jgi:hypothetical protein
MHNPLFPQLLLLVWLLATMAEGAGASVTNKPARGFSYFHDRVPEVPWSIHVFKIERAHHGLEFCTTLAKGDTIGMATVSEQLKTLPSEFGKPLAAINGDFYDDSQNYQGRPRDLQIRQGELVSSPRGHTCFWIDPAGNPCMTNVYSRLRVIWPDGRTTPIGLNEERKSDAAVLYTAAVGASTRTSGGFELVLERGANTLWLPLSAGQLYSARVRQVRNEGNSPVSRDVMVVSFGPRLAGSLPGVVPGALLQISTETVPNLDGVNTAIGGGPALVRNAKPMRWSGLKFRHPRTAIGWNEESIFLVEVDGRQRNLSVGMTLGELAAYMIKLGCEQAMNLDGGGSATFWVLGNVMNNPSEGRERPAPNALVVVQKRVVNE